MNPAGLRDSQMAMARYLRDPEHAPPPRGVEERRLKVYRELVYNNIEGFISGGFPVLRSLYRKEDWHGLVRLFIDRHRCRTPYFLEISQEFLSFLMEDFEPRPCDPPFIVELAHYEWVELALDVSEEESPAEQVAVDPLAGVPRLSPLAWVLAYQYPVHRIGPSYRPESAEQPTYLAVYRDRDDKVRFMELNAATARLLERVRDNEDACGADLLEALAAELGMEPANVRDFGASQLAEFIEKSVVYVA
jgi:hypothetical protein